MTTALDTSMPTIEPDGLDRLRNAETGLVIGYDLARFGMAPDKGAPQTVFDGWNQYRHVKGSYIERHDWADRKWVRVRYHAWLRNRLVAETFTPKLLRNLRMTRCPITREVMTDGTGEGTDATCERIDNHAGYADGNVIMMSARANKAKGNLSPLDITSTAHQMLPYKGLEPAEWLRLTVLSHYAWPDAPTHYPHALLPPRGMIVRNKSALLGMFINAAAMAPAGSLADNALRQAMPDKKARKGYEMVIEFLNAAHAKRFPRLNGRYPSTAARRYASEDAWLSPGVFTMYRRWASMLDIATVVAALTVHARLDHASADEKAMYFGLDTDGYDPLTV